MRCYWYSGEACVVHTKCVDWKNKGGWEGGLVVGGCTCVSYSWIILVEGGSIVVWCSWGKWMVEKTHRAS